MSKWYNRLTEIRSKNGLSQQELADKLEVHLTSINRYEKGRGAEELPNKFKIKLSTIFSKDELEYIEYGQQSSQNIIGSHNNQAGRDNRFQPVDEQTYKEGKQIGRGIASLLQSIEDGYPFDDPIVSATIAFMKDFDDTQKAQVLQCITEIKLGTKK